MLALSLGMSAAAAAVDGAPIHAAAAAALRERFGDDISVKPLSPVPEKVCDAGDVALSAQPLGQPVQGRIAVLLTTQCALSERQFPMWYALEVERLVPVLRRDLRTGERIGAADVDWVLRRGAVDTHIERSTLFASNGLRTTRPMRAGEILAVSDMRRTHAIESGQPVVASARVGGVALSLNTVASGQGDIGAPIRVRAPSGGYLKAQVTGPGVVEVQP